MLGWALNLGFAGSEGSKSVAAQSALAFLASILSPTALKQHSSVSADHAGTAEDPWDDANVALPDGSNRLLLSLASFFRIGGVTLSSVTYDPTGTPASLSFNVSTQGGNNASDAVLKEADMPGSDNTLRHDFSDTCDGHQQIIGLCNASQTIFSEGNNVTSTDTITVTLNRPSGSFSPYSKVYAICMSGDDDAGWTVSGDVSEDREVGGTVSGDRTIFASGSLLSAKSSVSVTFDAPVSQARICARIVVVEPAPGGDVDGSYEPDVGGLSPNVYLQFRETSGTSLADSSGNSRPGTLNGTGATLAVTALAANVHADNKAINLGSSAWISVPHNSVDTALTTSYASPWDGDHTGNRFIAETTICCYFRLNALPTGSNKAVVFAKSNSTTPGLTASYDGSFDAYVDSDGAVHVEMRSFRGRSARIRTPDGAVSASTTYHLVVQLGYDGVAAWLDGAKFEDGYANLTHVYGLGANIRGSFVGNTNDWTIGKAAWGGQADIQIDEFAIFNRNPTATITQANVNTLAQQGSTPAALAHYIWGALTVNESSYANIQAAVDDVNSSGGGTVLIDAGTYNENVTLKSNVRIKANGGTVTINGQINTATKSLSNLGVGSGDFLIGDRDIDVSNSRSVGDVAIVWGLNNGNGGAPTAMRHDRRWNTEGESNDPDISDGEVFLIESRTASSLTFEGGGSYYDITEANREKIEAYTPTSWIAIEDITVNNAPNTTVRLHWIANARLVNVTGNTDGDRACEIARNSINVTMRDCTFINDDTTSTGSDVFIAESKDCICKDHTGGGDSRAVDGGASNGNFVPTLRAEFHNVTDTAPISSPSPNTARYGAHGSMSDCIYWNIDCNFGGFGVTGWRHDVRWTRQGLNGEGGGSIGVNDGLGDSYYRDGWHVAPQNWFNAGEGAVGVDRCHFENIQRSATPTGNVHNNMNYGTGANVNTYTNVDGPDASWTEV